MQRTTYNPFIDEKKEGSNIILVSQSGEFGRKNLFYYLLPLSVLMQPNKTKKFFINTYNRDIETYYRYRQSQQENPFLQLQFFDRINPTQMEDVMKISAVLGYAYDYDDKDFLDMVFKRFYRKAYHQADDYIEDGIPIAELVDLHLDALMDNIKIDNIEETNETSDKVSFKLTVSQERMEADYQRSTRVFNQLIPLMARLFLYNITPAIFEDQRQDMLRLIGPSIETLENIIETMPDNVYEGLYEEFELEKKSYKFGDLLSHLQNLYKQESHDVINSIVHPQLASRFIFESGVSQKYLEEYVLKPSDIDNILALVYLAYVLNENAYVSVFIYQYVIYQAHVSTVSLYHDALLSKEALQAENVHLTERNKVLEKHADKVRDPKKVEKLNKEITKLTEEKSNESKKCLALKQSQATMKHQLDEANAIIKQQEKMIEELKEQNTQSEKEKQELYRLREFLFSLQKDKQANHAPKNMEDYLAYFEDKHYVVVGGHTNWVNKLKELLPHFSYIDLDRINIDYSFIDNTDGIFYHAYYNNHGLYRKLLKEIDDTPLHYLDENTNMTLTLKNMYELVQKYSD